MDIPNVIIYADEPKISSQEINGIYQGVFKEKIALIADQNFTIPALSLSYFDKDSKTVKAISSNPIDIEVVGAKKTDISNKSTIEVSPSQIIHSPSKVKQKIVIEKEDAYLKYLFLVIGFILGIGLMLLLNIFNKKNKKRESNIVKMIRKTKSDKELFNLLLPYSKEDRVISNALNHLEENLYKGASHKIDKEELMEFFEDREQRLQGL
ncbi:BatD [hydrothermal vent metagenome]|uniref:BatD n=1 Tax=hydrothermal vent metagenome TaxID=652676 RepID=A0A1W1CGG5_9ZZZZ